MIGVRDHINSEGPTDHCWYLKRIATDKIYWKREKFSRCVEGQQNF